MGKNDIRLSRKYGLNPTIPLCFWCGKEKEEIVLMGHIGDGRKGEDIEAPRNMFLDYEPCGICKKNMGRGFTVMEASEYPIIDGQPQIQNGIYPTGKWSVLRMEAAERIFGEYVDETNKIFVDQEVYRMLFDEKS